MLPRALATIMAACLLAGNANPPDDQAVIREYFAQYSTESGRENLRQLAFCIADRYPAQAREAIRQQATTTAFKIRYQNLLDFSCLKSALFKTKSATITDGLYQQLIAERLLVAEFGSVKLPDISAVPTLNHPHLPEIDRTTIPEQYLPMFQVDWALHRFDVAADCAARTAPEQVFALARTASGSAQEEAAFSELNSAIKRCGRDAAGQDIPIYVWRGMLLENLYRLADSARSMEADAGKSDAQG